MRIAHRLILPIRQAVYPYCDLQRGKIIEGTEWTHDFDWSQIKTLATCTDAWRVKEGEIIIRETPHLGVQITLKVTRLRSLSASPVGHFFPEKSARYSP